MTSLPTTPSAQHQFASNTQMEQKQQLLPDRNTTESSRLPPDGREFPVKRLMNGFGEKQKTKRFGDLFLLFYLRVEFGSEFDREIWCG
jgi:hypothetical protein